MIASEITRPAAIHTEHLLEPFWAKVTAIKPEAEDVSTFSLSFIDPDVQSAYSFKPGQFNMVYIPGFGESAISISSDADDPLTLSHTIRFVGNVTHAASRLKVGDTIGIRGPFGSSWPVQQLEGMDIFIACGGIGLPPLRPVLYHIIRHREKYGKVTLLYGARASKNLLYPEEYDSWRKANIDVEVSVDRGDDSWNGRVGVVPMWFYSFLIDAHKTAVLTCGPEIMIHFVIYEALARRIPSERIFVSLERNMKCGQGSCGHCQIGPYFVCKDGPVFRFDALEPFFNLEEF
jgi:NAD(P)H-flavin reductase